MRFATAKWWGLLQLVVLLLVLGSALSFPRGFYEDTETWNPEGHQDPRLQFMRGIMKRAGPKQNLCQLGLDQWGTICCKSPVYGDCQCLGEGWANVEFCRN